MYRHIPLSIAFAVVATSAAAFPTDKPVPAVYNTFRPHERSEVRAHAVPVGQRRHELVAMAPTEAEIAGWQGKVANAGPVAEAGQDLSKLPESGTDFNVLGMLAAAIGLAGMSVVRRMGRF